MGLSFLRAPYCCSNEPHSPCTASWQPLPTSLPCPRHPSVAMITNARAKLSSRCNASRVVSSFAESFRHLILGPFREHHLLRYVHQPFLRRSLLFKSPCEFCSSVTCREPFRPNRRACRFKGLSEPTRAPSITASCTASYRNPSTQTTEGCPQKATEPSKSRK